MRRVAILLFAAVLLFRAAAAYATIFGTVRGTVHDPDHRPIEGAQVTLRARGSDRSRTAETDPDGAFRTKRGGRLNICASAPLTSAHFFW